MNRVWITKAVAGSQDNVVWVELDDDRILRLTEDGRHEVITGSRDISRILEDTPESSNWERIA